MTVNIHVCAFCVLASLLHSRSSCLSSPFRAVRISVTSFSAQCLRNICTPAAAVRAACEVSRRCRAHFDDINLTQTPRGWMAAALRNGASRTSTNFTLRGGLPSGQRGGASRTSATASSRKRSAAGYLRHAAYFGRSTTSNSRRCFAHFVNFKPTQTLANCGASRPCFAHFVDFKPTQTLSA